MRVLYFDIDTLRPDHLGCYGYYRDTSPNIDKIAEKGIRFNRYYCTDAPCLPSRSALMTGQFGFHNMAVNHGGTYADPRPEGVNRAFKSDYGNYNLIQLFRKAGIHTCTVSSFAERHSSYWFNAGFNEVFNNTGLCGSEAAHQVYPDVKNWIDKNGSKDNWLLHINFWDTHTPYRVSPEFGRPYENECLNTWITEEKLEKHRKCSGPHSARELSAYTDVFEEGFEFRQIGKIETMSDLKTIIDEYDTGIKSIDEYIGIILKDLEMQGVSADDLCIIISSDHGENIGELGVYTEHATADAATCRIPMIIKWEKGVKGFVDNEIHANIDLCPTIADLLGLDHYGKWDGMSFANTILTGQLNGYDSLVISNCAQVCQRGVLFDNWLYMKTYHCGYHLYPDEMLFDIIKDPHEENNVIDLYPDVVNKAKGIYLDWIDGMMKTADLKFDPLWAVMAEGGPYHTRGMQEGYMARLRETGRGEAADELERKYPK